MNEPASWGEESGVRYAEGSEYAPGDECWAPCPACKIEIGTTGAPCRNPDCDEYVPEPTESAE